MATYTGKKALVEKPIGQLYQRFSDLSFLKSTFDNLPAEELARVGELRFEDNALIIVTQQVGEVRFEILERRAPEQIVFGAVGSPVPLTMSVNLKEETPETTELTTVIDIEIPVVMRAFVGPKLQQAADKIGELIANLSSK